MIELIQNALLGDGLGHMLLVLGLVFLGGVATSFTPCIFPMIPITFSVLGRSEGVVPSRRVLLSRVLLYGLGVAVAFVGLGVAAVLTRTMFGALTQHVLFKLFVANIFILLGLNTLGVFSIPQLQFNGTDNRSMVGVFVLGLTAGLSLSPCTLPILAVVLRVASNSSLFFGGLMMWVYAWGFMSLILLLSIFGKQALSKLFANKSYLAVMDKVLAILCFFVAQWILLMA